MTNKLLFKELCIERNDIPIFYTYGWFQSIYQNAWDIIIELQDGKITAFMPYVIQKKKGFKMLLPEPLTPYQGVWFVHRKELSDSSKLRFEKRAITNIINQLPKLHYFNQQLHPNVKNWLPFYWSSYQQTTRYSYILNDLSDLNKVYGSFKDKTRNNIKTVKSKLRIESSKDIDNFHKLKVNAFKNKKIPYDVSLERFQRIMNYCFDQNAGEILIALDENDTIQAMMVYIWDDLSSYYINSVLIENSIPGAMSLLIWEAIQRTASKSKAFDFEGSMIESIESYFRSFGGQLTPYFEITKTSSKPLEILKLLKG